MADIRVGTGVSNGTLLGVTTSFPFEYAYEKYIYMMYRRSGSIPAGAVKWYRWGNPTPNTWNLISPCTWNYTGIYYDYIYCGCRAGTGRYKVTFAGLSREYTVAEEPIGAIRVSSSPTRASVYLNGAYKGITTLTIGNLSPGTYNVKVTKSGYIDNQRNVYVLAGQTEYEHFTLTPITSTVTVNIKECTTNIPLEGAKVALSIGTKYTDSNGQCIYTNVPVGQYISGPVSKDGYETRTIGWNSAVDVTSVTQCIPKIAVPPSAQIDKRCSMSYIGYYDPTLKQICADETKTLPKGTTMHALCMMENTGGKGYLGLWIRDTISDTWLCNSGKVWFLAGANKQLTCTFNLNTNYDIELHAVHYENGTPYVDDTYGCKSINNKQNRR